MPAGRMIAARAVSLMSAREHTSVYTLGPFRLWDDAARGREIFPRPRNRARSSLTARLRGEPLVEPLLDLDDTVGFPLIVLAHRDRRIVLVGRQLNGDLLGDEGIGLGMNRAVEPPGV